MSEPRPCTLLVVENAPGDRRAHIDHLCRMKSDIRFSFLEAGDAAHGARLCEEVRVDCVLVGERLPDGSGTEWMRALHQRFDRRSLPVVMVLDDDGGDGARAALEAGAQDFIPRRECGPERLERAVRHALAIRELAGELEEAAYAKRLAESALRDNAQSLQMLIESIEGYAIVTLDPSGHVLNWNAGARQLFDYHDHDIIGEHVRRFTAPDAPPEVEPHEEIVRSGRLGAQRQARWFLRQDGSRFWGSSVVSPLVDSGAGVRGHAWVVHDLGHAPQGPTAPT